MGAVVAFLGMLLVSLVVALLAALQLADFFGANDKFARVAFVIASFAICSMALLAFVYAVAHRARTFNLAAVVLVLIALMLVSSPHLRDWIAAGAGDPFRTARRQETEITLEILVSTLIAVLVQWGLVRRRWLRTMGDEDLTLWPWVTTTLAGFAILNPFGLAVMAAALTQSATDLLWSFWATLASAGVGLLVVAAAVECYIRARILRRRVAVGGPKP